MWGEDLLKRAAEWHALNTQLGNPHLSDGKTEQILDHMRVIEDTMAHIPATHLAEVRAKADILASLSLFPPATPEQNLIESIWSDLRELEMGELPSADIAAACEILAHSHGEGVQRVAGWLIQRLDNRDCDPDKEPDADI